MINAAFSGKLAQTDFESKTSAEREGDRKPYRKSLVLTEAMTTPTPDISRNIVSLLKERAASTPSKAAYTYIKDADFSEESISYAELDQWASAICKVLNGFHGLGNRALLALPAGLDFIAAFFGCLYAGVIAVPIYPPRKNRSLNRFNSMARSSGARFALVRADLMEAVDSQFKKEEALSDLIWLSTDTIRTHDDTEVAMPYIESDTPAFLQFTSGSTAEPKGVVVTHGNLVHNLAVGQDAMQLSEADRGISWLPHFHDMGLIGGVLQAVFSDLADSRFFAPQLFLRKPSLWIEAISRYRSTLSVGPNLGYELCLQKVTDEQIEQLDLSAWRVAITGAEPVRPQTLRRFAERFARCGFTIETFRPSYGLAESTLLVSAPLQGGPPTIRSFAETALRGDEVIAAKTGSEGSVELVSAGQILGGQAVQIVDPDSLERLSADRVGEIWISGESVARGFWNNPTASRESFKARITGGTKSCYMRTGDLGFIFENELYIAGRLKDLIIIGGINYFPQDIEETVRNCHPALQDGLGAAFSVEDSGNETLALCHEIGLAHRRTDRNEIEDAIRKAVSLEHEIVIDHLVLTKFGGLPKTSSGKIQRYRCREQLIAGEFAVPSPAPGKQPTVEDSRDSDAKRTQEPLDATGVRLTEGIASILKMPAEKLDPDKPLTAQGISSLRAIEIQAFVEETFGHKLEAEDFFDDLNIRQLAERLSSEAR